MLTLCKNDRDPSKPSGGVYKIPIEFGNQHRVYIGQTAGTLTNRIYQHQYSLKRSDGNTALKNFLFEHTNATPLWQQASVIVAPNNNELRLWHEAVEIALHKNAINVNSGRTIAKIWQPLIEEVEYKND